MDVDQIKLVKNSWDKVIIASDQSGRMFYNKLFDLDPSLKSLFKVPIDEQVDKLYSTISFAVRGLDDLPAITPIISRLGKQHVKYGVKDKHYDTVGAALIWTLEQTIGQDFCNDTRIAWLTTYEMLANVMKDAAAMSTECH